MYVLQRWGGTKNQKTKWLLPFYPKIEQSRESESSGTMAVGDPHTHPINFHSENIKPEKTAAATNGGENKQDWDRRALRCCRGQREKRADLFAVKPIAGAYLNRWRFE